MLETPSSMYQSLLVEILQRLGQRVCNWIETTILSLFLPVQTLSIMDFENPLTRPSNLDHERTWARDDPLEVQDVGSQYIHHCVDERFQLHK